MEKLRKTVDKMHFMLRFIWYGGIFAGYIFSLIQAFAMELPDWMGIVLLLWPLVLALSVQMAKENLMASVPPFIDCQIDGWGALTIPKTWQIENGNTLACWDQASGFCAVLYKSEQMQASAVFTLPDQTAVTIQIPQKAISAELEGVFPCSYAMGRQKGKGYMSFVQSAGVYYVAVILNHSRMGKYIAEWILDEI